MFTKALILIVIVFTLENQALNCRSEGSLKSEELKRIYKECLKQNDSRNSNKNSSEQNWRDRNSGQSYSSNDWSDSENDRRGNRNSKNGDNRVRNWMEGRIDSTSYGDHGQTDRRDQMNEDRNNYNNNYDRYDRNDGRNDRNNKGSSNNKRNNMNSYQSDRSENRDGYNENDDYDSESQRNTYFNPNRRFKREHSEKNSGQRSQYNPNAQRSSDDMHRGRNSSDGNNDKNGKACAMHCFLDNLHMTGDDGMPDRYLVTNAMTKDVRNEDLRDFLQESIEECFQILDNENTENKCEFSKNLLTCLSEKGRSNCDDWKDDIQFP